VSSFTGHKKQQLAWLVEQRDRRQAGHPETIHRVSVELPTDNLWAAQLEAMAQLRDATPEALLHGYLIRGLEADLDAVLAAEGHRIGRARKKS
jgi:hypothetical protein